MRIIYRDNLTSYSVKSAAKLVTIKVFEKK